MPRKPSSRSRKTAPAKSTPARKRAPRSTPILSAIPLGPGKTGTIPIPLPRMTKQNELEILGSLIKSSDKRLRELEAKRRAKGSNMESRAEHNERIRRRAYLRDYAILRREVKGLKPHLTRKRLEEIDFNQPFGVHRNKYRYD